MSQRDLSIHSVQRTYMNRHILSLPLALGVACTPPHESATSITIPTPPDDDGIIQTYFVDAIHGDDTNSGLSTNAPWKTLARFSSVDLSTGDGIRLKRGGEWVGTLDLLAAGTAEAPITIEPYGEGSPPRIMGTKCLSPICGNTDTLWTAEGNNIYRAHLDFTPGVVLSGDSALHFINYDTLASAKARMSPGSSFFEPSTSTLFVRTSSGSSPAEFNLQAAQQSFAIQLMGSRHIRIQGIALRGSRRHCMLITHSTDIELDDLTIDYCGGQWDEEGGFYLGNGVEIAGASARITLRDSTLTDIFDSGVSPQAYLWSDFAIEDVHIVGNRIERCGLAGVEVTVWAQDAALRDIVIENNSLTEMGGGWAGQYNTNNINGVGIVAMAPDPSSAISGLVIRGNTITRGTLDGIALGFDTGHVVIDRNILQDNAGVGVFAWDDNVDTTTSAVLAWDRQNHSVPPDPVLPWGENLRPESRSRRS
ncbi:MAG TPA: right-handed parallel beta-helix repeat-containing protein, partial [Candidatus Tenderia sp.]|nr:right-handed parallel beta-helix repeat-containing protein [Candidatus Tenderia sp.]